MELSAPRRPPEAFHLFRSPRDGISRLQQHPLHGGYGRKDSDRDCPTTAKKGQGRYRDVPNSMRQHKAFRHRELALTLTNQTARSQPLRSPNPFASWIGLSMISWDKLGQAIEWRIRTLHRRSPDLSNTPSLFLLTKQHRRRARDKPSGLVLRVAHYMDEAGAHPYAWPIIWTMPMAVPQSWRDIFRSYGLTRKADHSCALSMLARVITSTCLEIRTYPAAAP